MYAQNYNKIQADKLSALYRAVLDIQAEFQSTDVQYYYESIGKEPLRVEDWNRVTEKAYVYGLWQMLHDLVPKKADEYLAEILSDAKIAAYADENPAIFPELKQAGNVLDTASPPGEFWQRSIFIDIMFKEKGYYENAVMQYTEFLRACWYYTKAVSGNTSKKNIEPYLKKVRDTIQKNNETN